jgi:hypothetical protein
MPEVPAAAEQAAAAPEAAAGVQSRPRRSARLPSRLQETVVGFNAGTHAVKRHGGRGNAAAQDGQHMGREQRHAGVGAGARTPGTHQGPKGNTGGANAGKCLMAVSACCPSNNVT